MSISRPTKFRFKAPHRMPKRYKPASPPTTPSPPPPAPADAAEEPTFAEALFDALSSADSAEYWSSVYGQAIHIYPRPGYINSDEEYVAYVQSKLWLNTREGVEATARDRARVRAAREKEAGAERARIREEGRRKAREEREREKIKERIEDEGWSRKTRDYTDAWISGQTIPWPVAAVYGGVKGAEIEHFFQTLAEVQHRSLEEVIKLERVRWHPDKIMQRFGVSNDSEQGREDLRRVNEVWRIVDGLWRRLRDEGH